MTRKQAIADAYAFREVGRRCNLAPRFGVFQCRRCSWSIRLRIPLVDAGMELLEQHSAGVHVEQLALVVR